MKAATELILSEKFYLISFTNKIKAIAKPHAIQVRRAIRKIT